MMSCGLTLPRVARLKVRISVIVITMVTNTTSVAPKLRASSLRRDEWNNIARYCGSERKTANYGLRTQDPDPGRRVRRKMRRLGAAGHGRLQARQGRVVAARRRRHQGP